MGRTTGRRVRVSLLLLAAALAGGCDGGFNRAWKTAGQRAVEVNDFQGRWQGTWKSEATGHNGGLRAIVTRQGEDTLRTRFHATYSGIFQFGYTAMLNAEPGEDMAYLSGKADLGWMAGGVYHYDGYVTPVKFYCTYRSKDDHGYFEMHRPEARTGGRIAGR